MCEDYKKWGHIVSAKTDMEVFQDAARVAFSEPLTEFPPHEQKVGNASVTWFESEPGVAVIFAFEGSADDRALGRAAVKAQLEPYGYRQAEFTIDGSEDEDFKTAAGLQKQAHWNDIMAKAKRIVQSGGVQILRNSPHTILASVQGDHGTYNCEIAREDPNSRAITQWQCECPWDQFAWQRTRKWKKYEGRVCSHVLAAFWASRSVPLDEDVHPSVTQADPGTIPGAPTPAVNSPALPDSAPAPTPPDASAADVAPPTPAPQARPMTGPVTPWQAPPAAPAGPDILPQFQQGPPPPPPVSIPGGMPPTPEGPVQYPGTQTPGPYGGGTFSSVKESNLVPNSVVYQHVQNLHSDPDDFHMGDLGERLDKYDQYQLTSVPVSDAWRDWSVYEPEAQEFANEKTEFPPIVMDHEGGIIDGAHRMRAAEIRGEHSIPAYVGVPGTFSSVKESRPVSEDWWNESTDPNQGRFPMLYHGTDHDRAQQIMREGLIPWDELERPEDDWDFEGVDEGHNWDPVATPRPGHVYLAPGKGYAQGVRGIGYYNTSVLEIDPRHLNPANINPDEDFGYTGRGIDNERSPEGYGPNDFDSRGEHADYIGLGNDIPRTEKALEGKPPGIAHRGAIPPHAIKGVHHFDSERRSLYTPNPLYREPTTVTASFEPDEYMYHLAPTIERARIQAHGIHPADPNSSANFPDARFRNSQPSGVYAFLTPEEAENYRPVYMDKPMDIWRFHRSQITDMLDQGMGAPKIDSHSGGMIIPGRVDAELHLPYEHTVKHAAKDPFVKQPDGFQNGNMVQLKQEDYGIAEGKSEAHGSGQQRLVPANSIGEVMGQDPVTKMVEVIYPLHNSGPLEPYHVRMYHFPSEIIPRPDIRRPGPFRRRR